MGWALCRRRLESQRAETNDRSRRASRGRRSLDLAQIAGRTQYEPITLERGVTEDAEFEQWANKVWKLGAALGSEVSLADFRKDIILEFYNEAGQVVLAYKIYRCWPSIFQALPDLDANGAAVAIEALVLENEGWERDASVVPPPEPSFNAP
jgi:phage tail-like protein